MGQPVGNTLPARMGNRPQRRFGRRVRVVRRRVFRPSGPVPRRGGRVRRRAQHTGRDPLYPARAPGRMGRQRQRIAADPLRGRCASLPGGDAADTLPGRIAGLVTPDDRNLRRRVPHLGAGACRGRHQLPGYQTHLGTRPCDRGPIAGRDIRRRGKPPHDPQCRRQLARLGRHRPRSRPQREMHTPRRRHRTHRKPLAAGADLRPHRRGAAAPGDADPRQLGQAPACRMELRRQTGRDGHTVTRHKHRRGQHSRRVRRPHGGFRSASQPRESPVGGGGNRPGGQIHRLPGAAHAHGHRLYQTADRNTHRAPALYRLCRGILRPDGRLPGRREVPLDMRSLVARTRMVAHTSQGTGGQIHQVRQGRADRGDGHVLQHVRAVGREQLQDVPRARGPIPGIGAAGRNSHAERRERHRMVPGGLPARPGREIFFDRVEQTTAPSSRSTVRHSTAGSPRRAKEC